jgi:two-component SAPR family response regulator
MLMMAMPSHKLTGGGLSINNLDAKLKQESIMVIDDDFDIAKLVKITLQRCGFENVIVFTKPLLALENFKINYKNYCLVISDIRMPEMSGVEFAILVGRINPKIKVLFMTAYDVNDDTLLNTNMKYNSNIIGVIQKPVTPAKLARMITEQINV